jgi:hypothetical protein
MNPKQMSTPELPTLFKKMRLEKGTDLDSEGQEVTTPRRGSKSRSVIAWTGSGAFDEGKEEEKEHDSEQTWPEGRPDDGTFLAREN